MRWYVIQPFYRRWADIGDALDSVGITYLRPFQFKVSAASPSDGVEGLALRPVPVLQMVFFCATEGELNDIRAAAFDCGRILTDQTSASRRPLTIPDDQILEFFKALSLNARYEIVEDRPDIFSKGERVRVIGGGKYEGLEGVVCRIKHDKHLIVRINGLCAISTDYVPQAFLVRQGDPRFGDPTRLPPNMRIAELAYYLRTLPALCREATATQALVEATAALLGDSLALAQAYPSLAVRLDITPGRVARLLAALHDRRRSALPDNDLPIGCHLARTICDELKSRYMSV